MTPPSLLDSTSLSAAERRMLDRFVEALREHLGDDLISVWLFGSRARGEPARWDSDVDVIVVTRDEERYRNLVIELAWKAGEAAGAEDPFVLAAHVRDPEWVEGRRAIDSFFIQEVDRDKVVLAGRP